MLTGLRDLTTAEQRASLSTLLDDEWHRIVKYGLGISDTATMDEDIFPRVFDTTGHLREMTGGPMRIELKDDARPTAVTAARSIPFAYRDQAKRQLDK
ncbi:hypothetical protein FJT64_009371 [Amphibalanus amphitrite]|uniref:Uncharacterized protein n=1 Tax=Amphibalanus amphitrite TaxID=1232801 RepID=A0A6A4V8N9_AMPAM|nr:hypothetical protein FJT64_009371 [Amphibalanus amphitrite]